MGGSSSVTNDQTIYHTDNMCFDGTDRGAPMAANGQLWIGSATSNRANNGGHVRLGTLTPGPGVSITNGAGTITIGLSGGATAIDSIGVQTGTNPIAPDSNSLVTINGAVVAAGTNPVRSDGTGANTLAIEVQTSQALVAADATKIGLSNFDSASFAVAATGFVTLNGASGFTWSDKSISFAAAARNGYFIAGSATATLPAAPANGDTIEFFVDGAFTLTIQANTGQTIQIATNVSSSAGTQVNTASGDACTLVYRSTDTKWCATSFVGAFNKT